MATNPITSPLPADLPEDWSYGQTVAPDGADAGLSQQHGYNYLMEQVNAAQEGVNTLNTNAGGLQGQIEDIVDGTTVVGNADKLDGKHAADFPQYVTGATTLDADVLFAGAGKMTIARGTFTDYPTEFSADGQGIVITMSYTDKTETVWANQLLMLATASSIHNSLLYRRFATSSVSAWSPIGDGGDASTLTGVLPVAHGGTGATTAAAARNALGLGNTTGALPVANGGTGQTSLANVTVGNADKLDGKHAADFAPAGYGLGSSPVYVSDWNEATKNGWYSSASVSAANQPRDGYFTGITCYTNDSYIVQRVTVYNSTNVPYVWYERRCVSGQWSEWRQDMPVAVQLSTPVRTDVLWAW